MNKQTFSFNGKQIIFAVAAIATLGLTTSPVKADDAVIQESVQKSVITGNDNVSVQSSSQSNRQFTESRPHRSNNTGIVQRSDQSCDQLGEYNTCVQDAQQSNSNHTRHLRHSRH